jgi:rhodanese-related sulfurtransferase
VKQWAPKYTKDQTLIFYCAWRNERTSARAARHFLENGYPKVYVLKGGWSAWYKAGYPIEKRKGGKERRTIFSK